ncbi:MAG: hypothetical protein EXQ93_07230 [Alphaproteobacteria bacterium]|nr:hypothetical protein [Alphaproteobacteria bacterium]
MQVQRQAPYTVETPTAAYSASFMLPTGPTIWTAEANFTGMSFDDIARSASIGAIAKLQQDGVVAKPAAPAAAGPAPTGGGGGLVLPGLN